jgi:hypothetical protein
MRIETVYTNTHIQLNIIISDLSALYVALYCSVKVAALRCADPKYR